MFGHGPAREDIADPLPGSFPGPLRSAGVSWALRLTAVAVLAGCSLTQYLSRASAPVQSARAPLVDPVTTGSIAQATRSTVLDPCAVPDLRR